MILQGLIVPGKPQPLLAPELSDSWLALRKGFEKAREDILKKPDADLILIYSTQWLSVIGHQIQADPNPKFVHVDQEFHELGNMPYDLKMDAAFAKEYEKACQKRGLHARTVAYNGFPIDTGTVVALKLLNPDNKIPACVVSCNMYADRAETLVLGKAASDAIKTSGRKAIAVAVTSLSNRMFTEPIDPKKDKIYSPKDDEWNRKLLELLAAGRLEDVSQLAREFSVQANGDQKMKAIWWLASVMGQNNRYEGKVYEYKPIYGTGAAIVGLTPSDKSEIKREFDEEDTEVFKGSQNILEKDSSDAKNTIVKAGNAPTPVGAYPHARKVGDLLYLSGVGPRQPVTNEIPGGPVKDDQGKSLKYDVAAQTRAVIENVKTILEASGSSLEKVFDITIFLVDMDRDFKEFNKVYAEYFSKIQPTRTTIAITALPTPIAVEFKVIANL